MNSPNHHPLAKALAIDPGGTTGFAEGFIYHKPPMEVDYFEKRMDEDELYHFLEETDPNYVICENFAYRNRARAGLDLTPMRLIGIINMYGNRHEDCVVYYQNASQAKAHFNNKKLKELEVYKRGLEHGRDAMRHLLTWYTFGAGYQFNRTEEVPVELR